MNALSRRARGFTLIEITIVILVIGILGMFAIGYYRGMVDKARMTQAKVVLRHLCRTETIYYGDHSKYTDDLLQLDFDPKKYDYYEVKVLLDNNAQDYTGNAIGIGKMEGDHWIITETGTATQSDNSVFK